MNRDDLKTLVQLHAKGTLLSDDAVKDLVAGVDVLLAETASISAECELPPGIRPADGEIARWRASHAALLATQGHLADAQRSCADLRSDLKVAQEQLAFERTRGAL